MVVPAAVTAIISTAIAAVIVVIVISIIVYVLIGFGAVGYLWAYIMLKCFKPYLPEEDLHAHDESVLLHEVDKDSDEESGKP